MSNAKKTDLAVRQNAALSADITDLMAEMGALGFENVGANEITIPQARILQSTSPAVADGKGRPGEIYNTMTEINYGTALQFVPLYFFGSRVKFIDPSRLDSGIDCQSRDAIRGSKTGPDYANGDCTKCPHAQWTSVPGGQDKGPLCIEFKNVLAVPVLEGESIQDSTPLVIAGKRKAIQPFKKFLTAANSIRVGGKSVAFFTSIWTMTTQQVKNEKGVFYVPTFSREGFVMDRDILMYLKGQYEAMKEVQDRLNVHATTDDDEAPVATHSDDF